MGCPSECESCGADCWRYDNDRNALCHACYIPTNPTFGWMISEYRRRGLPERALVGKTRATLEKYLGKVLDLGGQRCRTIIAKVESTGAIER